MTDPTRRCARCEQCKPLTAFGRRSGSQRLHSWCRDCKNAYDRDWYRRNRATHIANVAVLRRRQRERDSRILAEQKAVPCRDCGRRFPPYVMDFDHVLGEKVAAVAELARRPVSERLLLEEIAKCEVVCSNCRRERTYRRKERYRRPPRAEPDATAERRAWYDLRTAGIVGRQGLEP